MLKKQRRNAAIRKDEASLSLTFPAATSPVAPWLPVIHEFEEYLLEQTLEETHKKRFTFLRWRSFPSHNGAAVLMTAGKMAEITQLRRAYALA